MKVESLVRQLLIKAFGENRYKDIRLNIHVISKENTNHSYQKNLNLLLDGKDLLQMILIDYEKDYIYPGQELNFMKVSLSDSHRLESSLSRSWNSVDNMQYVNNIFYMTGLLNDTIEMAEKNGVTLVEALSALQRKTESKENREYYHQLLGYQTYYEKGLTQLKTINSTLDLVREGKLLADDYRLNTTGAPMIHQFRGQPPILAEMTKPLKVRARCHACSIS